MQSTAAENASRSTTKFRAEIIRAAAELALSPDQWPAWNSFVGTAEEAEHAIASVDAIADDGGDPRPSLPVALETTCHRLAVRLAAACRIARAAAVLQIVLSPRQRARADRLLTAITRELSIVPVEGPAPVAVSRTAVGRSAAAATASSRRPQEHRGTQEHRAWV